MSTCSAATCETVIARWNQSGLCKKHYNEERGTNHIRNARQRELFVEVVHREVLWERDNGRCHLCLLPVTDAWELDHVIPLSLGGPHCYANTAVACVACNRAKNNTPRPSGDLARQAEAEAACATFGGRVIRTCDECDTALPRSTNKSGKCRLHANRARANAYYAANREAVLERERAALGYVWGACGLPGCDARLGNRNKNGRCRAHRDGQGLRRSGKMEATTPGGPSCGFD